LFSPEPAVLLRYTVARSQNGMSAKFGQIRQNSAFLQKYVFTALNDKNNIKMFFLEILSQKKF
jgi:hypothetical protein